MSSNDLAEILPALGVAARATILLGVAGLVIVLSSRATAAVRHLIWLFALTGAAAMPLVISAAPSVSVRVPAGLIPHRVTAIANAPSHQATLGAIRPLLAARRGNTRVAEVPSRFSDSFTRNVEPKWFDVLTMAWLLGALVVVARCVVAHVRIARIVAGARLIRDVEWRRDAIAAGARVGVWRDVDLFLSDAIASPITSGIVRPVIVLPPNAADWTRERREAVLLHEMAHIARLDYGAQLIATAACTLYWFNPVVWIAAARLRLEAEHAADDRVLSAGVPGDSYATHLVELARPVAEAGTAAVAVGIAHRRTHIERRVRAMLDTTRSRARASSRQKFFVACLVLAVIVPTAGLRVHASAAPVTETRAESRSLFSALPVVVTGIALRQTSPPAIIAAPVQRRSQPSDTTFEETFAMASGGRLELDLNTGGDVEVHGWNQDRARVVVRLAGRDRRDVSLRFWPTAGGLRVQSDFERTRSEMSTSNRFELWIPKRSDIHVSSSGGGLLLEDLDGRFSGHTGGGSIEIRRTSGRSSLSTGGGDVSVSSSNLSGTVSTGGGSVILSEVTGGLRGSSGSGPVVFSERGRTTVDAQGGEGRTVNVTSNSITTVDGRGNVTSTRDNAKNRTFTIRPSDAALNVSKAGGAIRIDELPGGGTIHTGGGDIVIGQTRGQLTATTGGGDVTIRSISGDATVSTGAGDVRLTVIDDDGRSQTIEASSGRGTIEISLPESFNGVLELEAAYTEGSDIRPRIQTDWDLERTETREWDSSRGTPRKYFRARGTVGTGRGLVRISTVNGNVTVRRSR